MEKRTREVNGKGQGFGRDEWRSTDNGDGARCRGDRSFGCRSVDSIGSPCIRFPKAILGQHNWPYPVRIFVPDNPTEFLLMFHISKRFPSRTAARSITIQSPSRNEEDSDENTVKMKVLIVTIPWRSKLSWGQGESNVNMKALVVTHRGRLRIYVDNKKRLIDHETVQLYMAMWRRSTAGSSHLFLRFP